MATELTRGPWDPDSQHAGPPSALIAGELERFDSGSGPRRVGRISFEILRPVPIGEVEIEVTLTRGGRRVELLDAVLREPGGRDLMLARAWRFAPDGLELPEGVASRDPGGAALAAGRPSGAVGPPPDPGDLAEDETSPLGGEGIGYFDGIEYRSARGGFGRDTRGPATTWMRMAAPLVEGRPPSPLERVMVAADSGNGISAVLDIREFLFINVDLTVNLSRLPEGEWVCLDSITVPEPSGVGITDTMLFDEQGPLGRATQTLLVSVRS